MKRVLLILVLFAVSEMVQAQFLDLGIKSGIQFSNDAGRLSQAEVPVAEAGFNTTFGGYLQMHFNRLSVTPEFLFSSTRFTEQGAFGMDDVHLFKNDRFDLPLVFGYEFFDFLRIEAGPNFYNIRDDEYEKLFRMRNLQKEFTLGAAIDMGKLTLGARMVNDFGDIFQMDANTYQFTLSYDVF